jgi:hypothetical protein
MSLLQGLSSLLGEVLTQRFSDVRKQVVTLQLYGLIVI